MKELSATKLRLELFDVLNDVENSGIVFSIMRHGKEVARIVPGENKTSDWRNQIKGKVKIKSKDAFAPMDDVWKDHI